MPAGRNGIIPITPAISNTSRSRSRPVATLSGSRTMTPPPRNDGQSGIVRRAMRSPFMRARGPRPSSRRNVDGDAGSHAPAHRPTSTPCRVTRTAEPPRQMAARHKASASDSDDAERWRAPESRGPVAGMRVFALAFRVSHFAARECESLCFNGLPPFLARQAALRPTFQAPSARKGGAFSQFAQRCGRRCARPRD
jgi:hypothetical protein